LTGLPLFEHFLKPNHRKGSHIQGTVFPYKVGEVFKTTDAQPTPSSGHAGVVPSPTASTSQTTPQQGVQSIEDAIMALALYPFKFALTAKTIMRPLEVNSVLSRLNPRAQDVFCLVYLLQEQGNNPLLSLDDNEEGNDDDGDDTGSEEQDTETPSSNTQEDAPVTRGGRYGNERPYREPRQRGTASTAPEASSEDTLGVSATGVSATMMSFDDLQPKAPRTDDSILSHDEDDTVTDNPDTEAFEPDSLDAELDLESEGRHGTAHRRNRHHRNKPSPQKRKAAHHEKPHLETKPDSKPEAPQEEALPVAVTPPTVGVVHLPEPPERLFEAMQQTEAEETPAVVPVPTSAMPMSFTLTEAPPVAPVVEPVPQEAPQPEETMPQAVLPDASVASDTVPSVLPNQPEPQPQPQETSPEVSVVQLPQLPVLPPSSEEG
jgi:hypothetical protein